jgi:hypothetical protein
MEKCSILIDNVDSMHISLSSLSWHMQRTIDMISSSSSSLVSEMTVLPLPGFSEDRTLFPGAQLTAGGHLNPIHSMRAPFTKSLLIIIAVLSLISTASRFISSLRARPSIALVPERAAVHIWQLVTSSLSCRTLAGASFSLPPFTSAAARLELSLGIGAGIAFLALASSLCCSLATLSTHFLLFALTQNPVWITSHLGGLHGPTLSFLAAHTRSVYLSSTPDCESPLLPLVNVSAIRLLAAALMVTLASATLVHSADLVTHPVAGALLGWCLLPRLRNEARVPDNDGSTDAMPSKPEQSLSENPRKERGERLVQQMMHQQPSKQECAAESGGKVTAHYAEPALANADATGDRAGDDQEV